MSHPGSTKTRPRTTTPTRPHTKTAPRNRRKRQTRRTALATGPAPRILRLLDATPLTPAQERELWSVQLPDRIQAMYAGRLSLAQLTHWSSLRPDQIPRIAGEFAYLAIREPDWCEPTHPASEVQS
jgi:hypothetical protein